MMVKLLRDIFKFYKLDIQEKSEKQEKYIILVNEIIRIKLLY